ncbi:response regulator transcription factor [Mucilaginibacter segetis]|uniref:Response regulator transcription factor n=1 Tax=Mucilaginibacter segetis TaxID=2793071 RepID=A0A934ULA0_9SPHI|nr:response regulator transcription factor [Mucilaginibacter segetis]MBK0378323.1 response regulator transcription factor [Mucilaginibacter segetis]
MIKILLVEDHNVVRNGLRLLLDKETDIEVIEEVSNGADALRSIREGKKPDIIITAVNNPQMDGLNLIAKVKHAHPFIKIIILSAEDDYKVIIHAFKAGATGYMLKTISTFELIFGVRHIFNSNERYLCNDIALKLLDKLLHTPDVDFDVPVGDIEISLREVEILSLIADGYTNQEIAEKLFTSKRTIEGTRQGLIEKTGTRNTAALVRYAVLNSVIK